jgi:hypothetical protein
MSFSKKLNQNFLLQLLMESDAALWCLEKCIPYRIQYLLFAKLFAKL